MTNEQIIVEGLFSELLQKPGPKKDAMVEMLMERVSRKRAQFEAGEVSFSQFRDEVRRVSSDARSMGLTRAMIVRLLGG